MSDNAEEGIARVQMAQKDGQHDYHKRSVLYLNDRILTALFALAFLGLIVVWATAKSPLVIYGSLLASVLMAVLWGVVRIKRIQRIRTQRALQVQQMQSDSNE
jgi:hypothetical protein